MVGVGIGLVVALLFGEVVFAGFADFAGFTVAVTGWILFLFLYFGGAVFF